MMASTPSFLMLMLKGCSSFARTCGHGLAIYRPRARKIWVRPPKSLLCWQAQFLLPEYITARRRRIPLLSP